MKRSIFSREHQELRSVAERFFRNESALHARDWAANGRMDRGFFQRAGDLGIFGLQAPAEYGGAALPTYSYNVVVSEAAAAAHLSMVSLRVHGEIALPYILDYGTDTQRRRWMPGLVSGDTIAALAISEPQSGSDVAGIRTSAELVDDHYILNGAKTFITNGTNAQLIIVVARTTQNENRREGLTLLVVEADMPGVAASPPLRKLGLHYSDTAELFFRDVQVPTENRLGEDGAAFGYLAARLAQERVSIAVGAVAMSRVALTETVSYARQRKMFRTTLGNLQNTRFVLADVATEVAAAEAFLDTAVTRLDQNELSAADAAMLKLFCTEVQGRTVDKCLQVFGGYGYMAEYPISEMYADARVTRIYGGTNEVMKAIIAKSLRLAGSNSVETRTQ